MSLFFIDVQVGSVLEVDVEGVELPDASTATQRCITGLLDVAKHVLAADVSERITMTVRDQAGAVVATRSLCLTCRLY